MSLSCSLAFYLHKDSVSVFIAVFQRHWCTICICFLLPCLGSMGFRLGRLCSKFFVLQPGQLHGLFSFLDSEAAQDALYWREKAGRARELKSSHSSSTYSYSKTQSISQGQVQSQDGENTSGHREAVPRHRLINSKTAGNCVS